MTRLRALLARLTAHDPPTPGERVAAFIAIAAFFGAVFGPAIHAHFYVIEDHLLLAGREWGVGQWIDRIVGDAAGFQRFRPGYWLYHAVGARVFGSNPHLWHAATIAWGIVACCLLYDALRRLGADIVATVAALLILVVGGPHSWIWLNLIPQETIGMLWAALAAWAVVVASQAPAPGRWDALAIAAMAMAGLVKESFVLLVPALLLLRVAADVWFRGRSWGASLRALRVPIATGAAVFFVELAVVATILLSNAAGYSATASGLSLASFDPLRWARLLASLRLGLPLLVVAVVAVVLWLKDPAARPRVAGIALVAAAWVLPQFVLYGNGLVERYRFPAIVGVAALIAAAIAASWRRRWSRPLGLLGVLSLVPVLSAGLQSTTQTVSWLKAETVAVNRMLAFLALNVPADKMILMAGDSGTPYGFEATHSLPLYLREAGSRSAFHLWPLVSTGQRSPLHIAASKDNTAFRYPEGTDARDVGAIVVVEANVPSLEVGPLVRWLGATAWRELRFDEPFHAVVPGSLSYRKVGEVRHRVLLPASISGVPAYAPLLRVDEALAGAVLANPLLRLPAWGLERDARNGHSIVWLGHGEAEGLGVTFSATRAVAATLAAEAVPGPSRPDARRTVELHVRNAAGLATQRRTFEGARWEFPVAIEPGVNELRVAVLDEPTVALQPNGDTRNLLALVRGVVLR